MTEDRMYEADEPQQQEWLRQDAVTFGGLAGIGIVMVQPFLTASAPLDGSATICVVAFSIAIPLLAALILVNQQESFRRRRTTSKIVSTTKSIAQLAAFVGLVAGFWHIHQAAGIAFLVSGLVAVGAHSAGFWRLERDRWVEQTPPAEGSDPTGGGAGQSRPGRSDRVRAPAASDRARRP